MKYQTFDCSGKTIRGFQYLSESSDMVLVFHGFTGNKVDHHGMIKKFCEEIVGCKYCAYRFDFLGTGDSDGTFYEDERIASQLKQGSMLIDSYLKQGYRVHLFAFSMGGVIASHLARTKDIASLFLLSPAGNFNEILSEMLKLGKAYGKDYEFNGFHLHRDFVKEVLSFPYFENLSYKGPVKIVQGTKDQYVSQKCLQNYQKIYKQCECVQIEGADHCYSTLGYTQSVRKEIVEFYGKIKNMAIEKQ